MPITCHDPAQKGASLAESLVCFCSGGATCHGFPVCFELGISQGLLRALSALLEVFGQEGAGRVRGCSSMEQRQVWSRRVGLPPGQGARLTWKGLNSTADRYKPDFTGLMRTLPRACYSAVTHPGVSGLVHFPS